MKAILALLVAMTFLSACAKKDDSFGAQYAKNSAGQSAVSPETNKQAEATAGVSIDIMNVRTTNTSPFSFAAQIAVGGQISTVQMVQSLTTPSQPQTGTVTFGTYQMQVTAACANNADCNPYYMMGTVTLNGQAKIQMGFKFYRLEATAARDVFQYYDAAHLQTFESMVAVLNTK